MVVFPEDSGPKISTTRPRGKPPTPSAASNEIAPVGITEIGTMASFDPSRMMEPLPNCFSICANARSIALVRSSAIKIRLLCESIDGVDYTTRLKRIKGEFTERDEEKSRNETGADILVRRLCRL